MKQKILSSVAALFSATALFAQLPVSHTADNKNVVLEEFTGIYCTFCPDGHKLAQAIKTANPDDVVLINVHVGGYADPNGSDPDFRTPFGTALANQSGLQGYPSGTVNRHVFAGGVTALNRGDWAGRSSTILGQASYANVALEASIDLSTRELIVDVEVYYTGTGSASNKLNVALLQNGIEGPQTGMSANPSQILPNGKYEHNHMLRHLLTGQWGETITTTTSGTLIQRQYIYTIPADLNSVAYELGNLEIVAFLAEGNQEIVTGAEGPISYIVPPGYTIVDLAAATSMQNPSNYCDNAVTPQVTITNADTATVSSYVASYTLNGGTPVTETVTTPLAGGATETVTFPNITLPAGENKIVYSVSLESGSSYIELVSGNNTVASQVMYIVPQNAFATNHQEGFESLSVGQTTFANALLDNPEDEGVFVANNTVAQGISQNLGGFGNSSKSLLWNYYGITPGKAISLVFHKMDFSAGTDYSVSFNHAYAQYQSENDKLQVLVFMDCGTTWTSVFSKQGTGLSTAPAVTSNFFPTVTQWESNLVDLSNYDGETEVMVAFKGTSRYGNNLYVDDIKILDGVSASVKEENNTMSGLNAYPNPSNTVVNVDFKLNNKEEVAVSIINTVGQTVVVNNLGAVSGLQTTQMDVSGLDAGMYIIKVKTTSGEQTKRISVIK